MNQHYKINYCLIAITALLLLIFFGCSSSSSGDKDNISLSGYVTNGPINGATVTIYDKDDFSIGTTSTNPEGYFSIDGLPESPFYSITAEGGTLDGLPYSGTLKGFCTASPCNLTPFTSLVLQYASDYELEYVTAESDMTQWLGIEEEPFMAFHEGRLLEGVDLEAIREAILQNGLEVWIEQVLYFYKNSIPNVERGKGWFGTSPETYTLSVNVSEGGSVNPLISEIGHGQVAVFIVSSNIGYEIGSITGCGGSLAGNTYTTETITEACTIEALFVLKQYIVTFKDYDGTVLKTETISHGEEATAPEILIRAGYTFAGWDAGFGNVTGDLMVTAQYTINQYTVAFFDHDGTVLKEEKVDFGGNATPPADPIRAGYTFAGWDAGFGNVTGNLTVTAQYTINQYTVAFLDHDGTVLKVESVDFGGNATPPAEPIRAGYTFAGWDAGFGNVTGNLTVTAQYLADSLMSFSRIFGGSEHSLALKSNGTVWAWGENESGQLGDGTTYQSSTPVQVSDLSDVIFISGGDNHSLALKNDGTVWAWGENSQGQLGDGTDTNSLVPVKVSELANVIAASGGIGHSLALKNDGTVWAWGSNSRGQLGDGTYLDSLTPIQVFGLNDVVAISGGSGHNIVLKSDGTVWAWGANTAGQLGDGTDSDSSIPVEVVGIVDVIAISGGYGHSLALKSDGTVWAWGANPSGQLGDGSTTWSLIPVQVSELFDVIAISGGGGHSLALKSDGTVWAWGRNLTGQLGDGTGINSSLPVQVSGLADTISISSGFIHSLALKSDGTVWSWGSNYSGQLGGGIDEFSLFPVHVSDLSYVIDISAGRNHGLSLMSDCTVWAWGQNNRGQLGDGTNTDTSIPVQVSDLSDVIAISGGSFHSLALKNDGTVWAWGANGAGQLGNGNNTDSSIPVKVLILSDIQSISSGWGHSLALKSDGTVWAWGHNGFGQLGNGNTANSSIPIQVSDLSDVKATSGGWFHSLALKSDGTVWAWGNNGIGQIGDGGTANSSIPIQVSDLSEVIDISGGGDHSLALKNDGTVWAWGANWDGQLGNGNDIDSLVPVQVSGLSEVIAVTGGGEHSLALKNDGAVWAWGANWDGQLGDGTTESSLIPIQISGFIDVSVISAGGYNSLALKGDGTVWAWGDNSKGQLGIRGNIIRYTPDQVFGWCSETLELLNPRPGVDLRYLLIKHESPTAAVILFAGSHGDLGLHGTQNSPLISWGEQNFLVRTRKQFGTEGLVVAVFDFPSDKKFTGDLRSPYVYRMSEDHATDVLAIANQLKNEFQVPVWLVGTSAGTFSAAYLGINLQNDISGIILTAPLTDFSTIEDAQMPNGILDLQLNEVAVPTLIVIHEEDMCVHSPPDRATELQNSFISAPTVEVTLISGGRQPISLPCDALSSHGFYGKEQETVNTIAQFIKMNTVQIGQ